MADYSEAKREYDKIVRNQESARERLRAARSIRDPKIGQKVDELLSDAEAAVKMFEGSKIGNLIEGLVTRVSRAEAILSTLPTPENIADEAARLFPATEPRALSEAMREVFTKGATFRVYRDPKDSVAPVAPFSGYTTHGHPIPGVVQVGRPTEVARCGGLNCCDKCQVEAESQPAWWSPDANPYFVGNNFHCRHPNCPDTNWQGRSRVHTRDDETCPGVSSGTFFDDLKTYGVINLTGKCPCHEE